MIHVRIASLPEREEGLRLAVESLRPQVDSIFVGLNNYKKVPEYLNNGEWVMLDNSTGDAAKFYDVEYLHGYIFTCDDDLIYPSSYVSDMIKKIELYESVVTLHGKIYKPLINFQTPAAKYHCLGNVTEDRRVDVGGTGVMAWHSDHLKIKYSDFKAPNMADIWMAKACKDQGVPIYVIAHNSGYLKYFEPQTTIWEEEKKTGFSRQTELLKTFL
jgi:hypothetical protein